MTNKERFIDLVRTYVKRDGVDEWLQDLEDNGFYEAWASTTFHCNYTGGLVEHTLNVIDYALKLADTFGSNVSKESIVLCSAGHDNGKAYGYYVNNLLKSGKTSGSKPKKINPKLMIKSHAMRSLNIMSRFFDLTESEKVCILSHDGWYENTNREYMLALDELLYIVHSADLYVARFVEPVKSYKGGEKIEL
nr:MAG TPA: putative helicase [Caudoviricetes sp.]